MKKTCSSDFYLIGFPFFGNYCIFSHFFDFVCQADVHELLKAQQATAIVTPIEVLALEQWFSTWWSRLPLGVLRVFSRGRERYLVFVRNPFIADSDVVTCNSNDATQEEFIALKNNLTAEDIFKETSLPAYWSAMVASCSKVASTAIQLLMPFSST